MSESKQLDCCNYVKIIHDFDNHNAYLPDNIIAPYWSK